ncbi:radical SAM protein [Pseudodesulfovibrio sediminis]|uniref:Tungsten cofactor oxidoreductase radical SAM maturase n=1 Tax=Pseudodesulfovibrio sediminis TaxID=2810563 RepID=A0ABN6ES28_9BACT|nr:radical SAM protein [Pseudodesulfovibrio sediminis]BCS89176.1 tungsten cofactor oxidoreductase radical SAM maturase [Pseudodesulfovibrio sediminis]
MNTNERLTKLNDQLNDRYVPANEYENVITYPKLITLTTTLRCNYRCWMCYQEDFTGDLDWRVVEKIRHVLPSVKTFQLFGGEPLLYNRFEELCDLAGENFCEIEVITNGSPLTESKRRALLENNASIVKISLEAATQATYDSIRGGDLEQVLGNLEKFAEERARMGQANPTFQINFVAMERNIRELPALVERAASIGVDKLLVLYVNAFNREDIARESLFFHQELSDENMIKAVEAGRRHGLEVTIPDLFSTNTAQVEDACMDSTCHSPWKNCIINLNGDVLFCCGRTGGPIGNLLEQDFDDMWYGDKITRFRKLVNTSGQPDCCNTCRVKGRNIRDIGYHIRSKAVADKLMAEFGVAIGN